MSGIEAFGFVAVAVMVTAYALEARALQPTSYYSQLLAWPQRFMRLSSAPGPSQSSKPSGAALRSRAGCTGLAAPQPLLDKTLTNAADRCA